MKPLKTIFFSNSPYLWTIYGIIYFIHPVILTHKTPYKIKLLVQCGITPIRSNCPIFRLYSFNNGIPIRQPGYSFKKNLRTYWKLSFEKSYLNHWKHSSGIRLYQKFYEDISENSIVYVLGRVLEIFDIFTYMLDVLSRFFVFSKFCENFRKNRNKLLGIRVLYRIGRFRVL